MEFWTGWFDHWGEKHLGRNISPQDFNKELRSILEEGASVNFYMFHGGTNFGFMNGANWGDEKDIGQTYRPTVSSYGMCICMQRNSFYLDVPRNKHNYVVYIHSSLVMIWVFIKVLKYQLISKTHCIFGNYKYLEQ